MSLSPLEQAHVQSCGSSILSLMRHGPDLEYDFNNCVFSDSGEREYKYQCLVCGLTEDKMPSCARCHAVAYCSRSCQKIDWKSRHKYECQGMRKAYDGLKGVGKI
ncbi:MAG: zinc finger MYND domain-containing protein [Sphingobacteriaceae bacterium]|nr:MAG: zinc finger MYND domain-containing protein [Sphingobacteriaceae bacterium]